MVKIDKIAYIIQEAALEGVDQARAGTGLLDVAIHVEEGLGVLLLLDVDEAEFVVALAGLHQIVHADLDHLLQAEGIVVFCLGVLRQLIETLGDALVAGRDAF